MAPKRSLPDEAGQPRPPSDWNALVNCILHPHLHAEPRLETAPSPAEAVAPLVATTISPSPPQQPMALEANAAVPAAAELPSDPTAHWGPICAATRMWIGKLEVTVAAALTKAAKEKCNWASIVPEGRMLLYDDVKNVRDKAVRFGQDQVIVKVGPILNELREQLAQSQQQLARAQQDLDAERILAQEFAAELEALKSRVPGQEASTEEISLDEIMYHLASSNPMPYVSQPPTPATDAMSEMSDVTINETSRESGLSIAELEELLLSTESFEDERGDVRSVPVAAALFQSPM